MPGTNRLRTTVMQLNGDLVSKNKLAESLQASAQVHADNGDEVRAKTDQESADRYLQDAQDIEGQIASMQALIIVKEQKMNAIDKEMDELTKDYEKQMARLKNERDSLT